MRPYITLMILLSSCRYDNVEINYLPTSQFLLIDTSRAASQLATWKKYIDFPIYYIGPVKDTIHIGMRYRLGRTPKPPFRYKVPMSLHYTDHNLNITVDTSLLVNFEKECFSEKSYPIPDSVQSFYAHLVTLKNISDSIIWMGRTFSIFYMHLEIKDRAGHWTKATRELNEIGLCTTNEPDICLKPGEIIISKVPLLQGRSPVEARLAFGRWGHKIYSNSFYQSVD